MSLNIYFLCFKDELFQVTKEKIYFSKGMDANNCKNKIL